MRYNRKIKIVAALIACAMLLFVCVTVAAGQQMTEGTCGPEAVWSFDGETLTISGSGPMDDFGQAPWYEFRRKILYIVVGDGITRIGNNAFYDCIGLYQADLADSITSIGDAAFYGCGRAEIQFPKGLTEIGVCAFYDCLLREIELPDGLLHIRQMAFAKSGTQKVVLPDSIQTIGMNVFYGCKGLEEVRYKGTRAQWVNIQIHPNEELFQPGIRFDGDRSKLLAVGIPAVAVLIGVPVLVYFREKRKKYADL